MRLFVAFRLPAETVDAVVAWQEPLLRGIPGVRLTPASHLHVTAVFLGTTPEAALPRVRDLTRHAVRNARPPRFRVERYRETPRVAMLALREEVVGHDGYAGRGSELAGHLMVAFEAAGLYVREFRDWRPHLTVARFATLPRLRAVAPALAFTPPDLALFESVTGPGGSAYHVIESFPFRDGHEAQPPVA